MTAATRYASIQTVSRFSDGLAATLNDVTEREFPEAYKLGIAQGLSRSFDLCAQYVGPEIPRIEHARVMTIFREGIAQKNEEGLCQIIRKLNCIVYSSFLAATTPLYQDVGSIVADYV